MTTQSAYPLTWPATWKRTPFSGVRRAAFGKHSMIEAVDETWNELRQMAARDVVISSNVELRNDGFPRSNQRKPDDCGVAVYFKLNKQPRVLACDRWDSVEHNLWAIAKHIGALRGQERWGVGTVEQAFQGYAALPSGQVEWWTVLGLNRDASPQEVNSTYRDLAMRFHPDRGGSETQMRELNAARDAALKEVTR